MQTHVVHKTHTTYIKTNLQLLESTETMINELDKQIDDMLWENKELDDKKLSYLMQMRESLSKDLENGLVYTPAF